MSARPTAGLACIRENAGEACYLTTPGKLCSDKRLPIGKALFFLSKKEPKSDLACTGWGLYDWILPTHKALEKTWTLSGKESKRRQKPLCQGRSGYRTTFPGRSRTKGLQFPRISDIMAPLWSSTQAGRRGVTRNLVGHESVARVRIPAAPP